MVYVLFDHRSLGIRVESILNQDRYVFVTYRIDGRRIHHFCTEITKFGSLYISQLADSIGRTDHTRVGCHDDVYIRPNLQTIGIESCGNNSCGIVGTAPAQIRYVSRNLIRRDESGYQRNPGDFFESLPHQPIGQFRGQCMFIMFLFCLDKST